jgi:(3S)-malyl-CoA thioesterase
MQGGARPYRSVLYIPASRERALEKARELAADAIIFDLEDAVAPEEKVRARELLAQVLSSADYGTRARIVRGTLRCSGSMAAWMRCWCRRSTALLIWMLWGDG